MGEIKILFDEDDYEKLIKALFNFAVDMVREMTQQGSLKVSTKQ